MESDIMKRKSSICRYTGMWILSLVVLSVSSCSDNDSSTNQGAGDDAIADDTPQAEVSKTPVIFPADSLAAADTLVTDSGLQFIELTVGAGARPTEGNQVFVHYTGLLEDGSIFDSSYPRGEPLAFPIGRGRVIAGWDEGIARMAVGGRARLIIPPDLGYGSRGAGDVIPPNATIIFDVWLVNAE
jgi:FKBP-type peptidyl-prolyl cis-trans isomerase